MRFLSKLGFATALATATIAIGATPAIAAKDKKEQKAIEAKPKMSKGFMAAYAPLTKLLGKDDAAAKAALPGLEAAIASDDDKYVYGKFVVTLGSKLNDPELQFAGLKAAASTQIIPAQEKALFSYFIGKMSFGKKDYDGTIQALNTAKTLGHKADDMDLIMALSNFQTNRNPAAFESLRNAVAAKAALGQKADESWFGRGLKVALDTKDAKEISYWSGQLLRNYPTASNWRAALSFYRDGVNLSSGENLDLMRLMRKADAMASERDYGEYVDAASPLRMPGEVISVIREAQAKGRVTAKSTYLNEQLQVAQSRENADRASLPESERASRSSANGKIALGTADAFLSYGNNAKAIDLYSLALQKGGIEPDVAYTRRAIAKVDSGDLAGAKADLALVTGANRRAIADYWLLYLELSAAPAPVVTAPTAAN